MKPSRYLPILIFIFWAPLASGQHYLAVKDGDKTRIVVAARGTEPLVLNKGKLEVVHAARFALAEGGEYLPLYVAVRHPRVMTSSATLNYTGEVNKEFHLNCELETAYSLEHVFLVIFLNQTGGKSIFLWEVGQLEPRHPSSVSVVVPMQMNNEPGNYQLYLFSGGRELFHTMMPFGLMDAALNRMVRERIKDVQNSPVTPILGPAPEYPAALSKKGIEGSATLSFTIDTNGSVSDPAVVEASQPEFGEAALAVIRQWRFLPKVKNGQPVRARAEMPFMFSAPKEK